MQKKPLKFGELFAGAGGLGIGFILANHPLIQFEPIFAVDNDCNSLESYSTNLKWLSSNAPSFNVDKCETIYRDISTLKTPPLLRFMGLKNDELDILIGGPPCQGYSSSNRTRKKESKGDRNRLTRVFMDKVAELCPKAFLLENVQGVQWTTPTEDMAVTSSQAMLPLFDADPLSEQINSVQQFVIEKARSAGYKVWYSVIDSAKFGIPQYRNRFFLFGVREDLIPNDLEVDLNAYLRQFMKTSLVTVGEAIDDLPALGNGEVYTGKYSPSNMPYVQLMRRYMKNDDLFDHFTTKHKDYVIERYKFIAPGENWEAIRDQMTNYANVDNTHSNIYRRLENGLPANTITHYRKSMIIHPSQHRGLSFREACRLQSFPDWFRFVGGREDMQQQLANAVPPLLAESVASAIAHFWVDYISCKK